MKEETQIKKKLPRMSHFLKTEKANKKRLKVEANFTNQSDYFIFSYLASYPPLADTCMDFYKLGIVPEPSFCLSLKGISVSSLQCCWNNLVPSTVSKSIHLLCNLFTSISWYVDRFHFMSELYQIAKYQIKIHCYSYNEG